MENQVQNPSEAAHATSPDRLAIDGGPPACPYFTGPSFPGGELIAEEEEAAVIRVVRSKRLFRHYGLEFPPPPSENAQLEQELAAKFGASSALTVSSGTAALQCAITALKTSPGDEILVPAFTFIASAAAVVLAGCVPVIVDIDASLGMDPEDVERRITKRTKAIVAVHMRGAACDLTAIKGIADRHGLPIIEDVAQAAGASLGGRALGSIGALGCFSFQFQKVITCGEGGAIIAGDAELMKRALIFSDTVSWMRPGSTVTEPEIMLGMNARLPELSAAVLRVQLGRLDGIVSNGLRHQATLRDAVIDVTGDAECIRKDHGPGSDNGTVFIFHARSRQAAAFIVKALQAEHIWANRVLDTDAADPGAHVYYGWKPVVERRSWHADGSPWSHGRRDIDYSPDAHPHSVERLARGVHIDLHASAQDEHFILVAKALRKVLRDPRAGFR